MPTEREYQPDFDASERERALEPRYQLAKDAARALLKKYKITKAPVDVEHLIDERGLKLKKVDISGKLSGVLHAALKEIVVNTRDRSIQRQRFTMAHELGHWELRHHDIGELPEDTRGYAAAYDGDEGRPARSPVEAEANAFAAELLMPGSWIRKLPKSLGEGVPQRLADEYLVSCEAMFYQLMSCHRL